MVPGSESRRFGTSSSCSWPSPWGSKAWAPAHVSAALPALAAADGLPFVWCLASMPSGPPSCSRPRTRPTTMATAGEHLVEDDAARVDVGPRVDVRALDLLRREVRHAAQRVARGGDVRALVRGAGDPEVDQLHDAAARYQDVAGLHVAVNHAVL